MVSATALLKASPRELLLFSMWLYQSLPHYVPKTTLEFSGGLHAPLTKALELSNPSRKPIVYAVRLEGASCFRVHASTVRLEPRSTATFPVEVLAKFLGPAEGRLEGRHAPHEGRRGSVDRRWPKQSGSAT